MTEISFNVLGTIVTNVFPWPQTAFGRQARLLKSSERKIVLPITCNFTVCEGKKGEN